jgi:hypothetical protein
MNRNPKQEKRTLEGMIKTEVSRGVRPIAKTQNFTQGGATAKAAEAATDLVDPGVAWMPALTRQYRRQRSKAAASNGL